MAQRILTRLGDYLELTDDPRTQIEGIIEAAKIDMKPLVEQAMAARRGFRESHDPGTFDEDAFRAAAQQQAALQVEIKIAAARTMHQVYGVLTDAQRQKLKELHGLLGPRREGPGARFGRGPHGS